MKCSASVFLGLIFLGTLTPADACVLNGPRYRLATDTVRWSLELSSGKSCIHGVRFNNVVFDKLTVVSAPQTGHVTLHGPGFSYKAASDFRGRDFFSLMVSGTTNKVPGSSTIEVVVSVSRASELKRFPPVIPPLGHPLSPAGSATSSPPPPSSSAAAASSFAATTKRLSTGRPTHGLEPGDEGSGRHPGPVQRLLDADPSRGR